MVTETLKTFTEYIEHLLPKYRDLEVVVNVDDEYKSIVNVSKCKYYGIDDEFEYFGFIYNDIGKPLTLQEMVDLLKQYCESIVNQNTSVCVIGRYDGDNVYPLEIVDVNVKQIKTFGETELFIEITTY